MKPRGDQKPDHCCFHRGKKYYINPKLSPFTLTCHLERKAVWNSTHEQDMKWHTQTLLGKKETIKRGGLFKKRFNYTLYILYWF